MRRTAAGLLKIHQGARNPAIAKDPELDYDDAAELQFLLETLAAPTSDTP